MVRSVDYTLQLLLNGQHFLSCLSRATNILSAAEYVFLDIVFLLADYLSLV
jgi:hypothetical protein